MFFDFGAKTEFYQEKGFEFGISESDVEDLEDEE